MVFRDDFTIRRGLAGDGHQWAVCCSGGGIRSAAYSLGGLQRLSERGLPGPDDQLVGVSGGSYTAAAWALAAHEHPRRRPYAPGSPEEHRLRNNTHYLAPDARTGVAGVLSLLFGAVVISFVMLAPVLLLAYAVGGLARWAGVLRPGGGQAVQVDLAAHQWWVLPVAGAVAVAVAYVGWRFDRYHRGTSTTILGWSVVVAAGLAFLCVATPLLVHAVLGNPVDVRASTAAPAWSWVPPSILAAVTAAVALLKAALDKVDAFGKPVLQRAGWLARGLGWLGRRVAPWLGLAVVVVLVLFAWLAWVRRAAMGPWDLSFGVTAAAAAAVLVAGRFLVDLNRLSMHDFYRWRLAEGYAASPTGTETPSRTEPHLSDLGDARLAIATAANVNANRERPPGHGCCLLTFDPDHVELWTPGEHPPRARAHTRDMELTVGPKRLTLFDIVAVSGAALSPLMGSRTRAEFRLPMVVANARLGLWLPHPAVVAGARERLRTSRSPWDHRLVRLLPALLRHMLPHRGWHGDRPGAPDPRKPKIDRREALLWAHVLHLREQAERQRPGSWRRHVASLRACVFYQLLQPTLALLWAEAVGHLSYRATWIYATDGGHYDNLGLLDALHRDADRIIVLDAGGDPSDRWSTIGDTEALARIDAGVEIDLDPSSMRPSDRHDGRKLEPREVAVPWATGTFTRRATPGVGRIWVCKLGWWQGCSWDVRAYAAGHRTFPNETTAQQLYDADEFEAYRALGHESVDAALRDSDLGGEAGYDDTEPGHTAVLFGTTLGVLRKAVRAWSIASVRGGGAAVRPARS